MLFLFTLVYMSDGHSRDKHCFRVILPEVGTITAGSILRVENPLPERQRQA